MRLFYQEMEPNAALAQFVPILEKGTLILLRESLFTSIKGILLPFPYKSVLELKFWHQFC